MVNASFTREASAVYVTIEREEKLNALDTPTKAEITERLESYRDDDEVRAVVIQSEGDRAFCAGGDIAEIPEVDYSLSYFTETWHDLFETMMSSPVPIIAKVNGFALGGGFDLLLHTDFVVAADDARLGQPEVNLGIINHFSPPMLLQRVGTLKTFELLMTGEPISGAEAEEIGLVTRSVPTSDLDEEVEELVTTLTNKSPRVLGKLKRNLYTSTNLPPTAAREHMERVSLDAARTDRDYREGVDAQLEDRDPDWVLD